ncbi:hypothetical protein VT06_08350 [Arsukibacterium sp. MJ3]|uniref:hypothetical protein n=1 Tax=Arsukibacterium sp. MJ3 TaxID=1632859 RepID=UPI000626F2C0|nr:hypothetical protein [Arsukibacterium sp. MJ3]KKO48992.1 hypothetical protein VT06_08350 [Arsukibacterium sp. MJ3]
MSHFLAHRLSTMAIIFSLSLPSMALQSAEVAINDLGALALRYAIVTAATDFAGQHVSAQVAAYPNSAMPIGRVIENAAMLWLEQPGTLVKQGQPVLQLEGAEVQHFLTEYDTRKTYFQLVKTRYDDNQRLFEQKAISSSAWQELSLTYQNALLDFEHLDHFYERISAIRADRLQITISAPIAGVVLAAESSDSALFRMMAPEHIRLRGAISDQQARPAAVRFNDCQLPIARIDTMSQGFSRIWWSAPLISAITCQVNWQQQLSVLPIYAQAVYRVPSSSIVRHDSQQHVWMKTTSTLRLVPVTIIAKEIDAFWVQSGEFSSATEVLSQSVSAVYGHYLGLGGE